MIGFGQLTMIPDANFEQELINLGYDNGAINGSVYTAMINTVTSLDLQNAATPLNIADLTGIEDFTALTHLECDYNQLTSLDLSANTSLTFLTCTNNQLTSLDVSQNIALTELSCYYNQLTNLDVSQNTALINLRSYNNQLTNLDVSANTALDILTCGYNQLTSLDVSNNTALGGLGCYNNQLTSLDVSNNTALTSLSCCGNQLTSLDVSTNTTLYQLYCYENQLTSLDVSTNTTLNTLDCRYNQLTSLDVRNTSIGIGQIDTRINPNLSCINVDDVQYSLFNWTDIDPQHYFSTNCSGTGIEEHTTNKELLKVTDLLGRETKQTNQPLFYIYDDGTVEKRIVIE